VTPSEQYGALLRDQRWRKKRLEILARDNNRCAKCGKARAGMNVHHKQYVPDAKPWQVPNAFLETLCPACHRGHHQEEKQQLRDRERAEFDRETLDSLFPPNPIVEPPAAPRSAEVTSAAGAQTPVGIYYITAGISTWKWLCAKHVAAREAVGWSCKRTGNVEHECDDCEAGR